MIWIPAIFFLPSFLTLVAYKWSLGIFFENSFEIKEAGILVKF